MARTRLAVLYGGRSAEHQVSVVSARSVMEALDPERFEVVPIAITREGAWLLPDRSPLVLAEAGLPQAPYLVVTGRDWRADPDGVAAEVAGRLAYPVFTKPARLGSSIGITKVKTPGALAAGLAAAFAHDPKALVEQGVVARELEC